jgi:hypothetical protein
MYYSRYLINLQKIDCHGKIIENHGIYTFYQNRGQNVELLKSAKVQQNMNAMFFLFRVRTEP